MEFFLFLAIGTLYSIGCLLSSIYYGEINATTLFVVYFVFSFWFCYLEDQKLKSRHEAGIFEKFEEHPFEMFHHLCICLLEFIAYIVVILIIPVGFLIEKITNIIKKR